MVRLASIKNSKYSFYLSPIIHVIHVSPVPGCPGADGNSGEPDCQMLKSHVRGQLESDLCIIISCVTLCSRAPLRIHYHCKKYVFISYPYLKIQKLQYNYRLKRYFRKILLVSDNFVNISA